MSGKALQLIDDKINKQYQHTKPVLSKQELLDCYNEMGLSIDDIALMDGEQRYIFENNEKPIALTLQGAIYRAIDIVTGRRVVVKTANKYLVKNHLSTNDQFVFEDIRNESMLLNTITNKENTNAGFSKFVEFFENDSHYFLVSEYCGVELLHYIKNVHPFNENNESLTKQWRQYIQYHFRFIAKSIDFLHNECNMAHCDLSLENMVIDDTICRIIDFGLAKETPNNSKPWKSRKFIGKTLYQSPEIRNVISNNKNNDKNDNNNNNNNSYYNPQSADVWALGVMLFIMLVGSQPWYKAENDDMTFNIIFNHENGLEYVLNEWKSTQYVDTIALDLLKKIFVCEKYRPSINDIMNHKYVGKAPRSVYVDNKSLLKNCSYNCNDIMNKLNGNNSVTNIRHKPTSLSVPN